MKRHKKSAFTLVELIVVITILAILGTIAFISLQGYSAVSRDSVRISDVGTMTTALEVFQINSGRYPLPDQNGIFTYNGETLWTQGLFAGTVVNNLSREIGKAPVDPLTDKEYTYSISGNKNEFQILNLLEGELVLNGTTQTNAAESVRTPRVTGSYNGIFVKTKSYLLPIPSIITSLDFNVDDETIIVSGTGITSQVISGGTNIPKIGNIKSGTGGIEGLSFEPVSINNIVSDGDKATVIDAIKNAYSSSTLKDDGIYEYVIGVSGEENLAGLFDTIVLENFEDIVVNTDTVAPEGGTFVIDEGTGSTSTTSINLTIGCPEEEGVEMFISGDVESEDTWKACETTKAITLSSGDAEKTITMKFKDSSGNETTEVSSSITYAESKFATRLNNKYAYNYYESNNYVWCQEFEGDKCLEPMGQWTSNTSYCGRPKIYSGSSYRTSFLNHFCQKFGYSSYKSYQYITLGYGSNLLTNNVHNLTCNYTGVKVTYSYDGNFDHDSNAYNDTYIDWIECQ